MMCITNLLKNIYKQESINKISMDSTDLMNKNCTIRLHCTSDFNNVLLSAKFSHANVMLL